jgi:hypothetical protein
MLIHRAIAILFLAMSPGLLSAEPLQSIPTNLFETANPVVPAHNQPQEQFLPDLAKPSPLVVPPLPNQFNEGIFTAKEQFHDSQLTDFGKRIGSLEGTANFVRGAAWALGIIVVFVVTFWRGIVKLLLDETRSRILRP